MRLARGAAAFHHLKQVIVLISYKRSKGFPDSDIRWFTLPRIGQCCNPTEHRKLRINGKHLYCYSILPRLMDQCSSKQLTLVWISARFLAFYIWRLVFLSLCIEVFTWC